MIIDEVDKSISMPRGDSDSFTIGMFQTVDDERVAVPFATGDKVYFTLKKRPSDTAKSLQKVVTTFNEDDKAVIPLLHADTKDLPTGRYYYDIQVTFVDGTVKTILGPALFTLAEEVTHD